MATVITYFNRRYALIITALVILVILITLHIVSNPWFWRILLGVFRFHRLWPLLILAISAIPLVAGNRNYKKNGLPQFFWGWISFVTALLLILTLFLIDYWAMDWPYNLTRFHLATLFFSVTFITAGLFIYLELWRLFVNGSVVGQVNRAITKGAFVRNLKTGDWGSLHCLRIVQNRFYAAQQTLIADISQANIEECLKVGEDLNQYLTLKWPDNLISQSELDCMKTHLLREMITLCLLADSQDMVDHWLNCLRSFDNPYQQFLVFVFDLSRKCPQSGREIKDLVDQVLVLFEQIPPGSSDFTCETIPQRDICAYTWLALSPNALPKQACFDVWMALQNKQNQEIFIPVTRQAMSDLATILARQFIVEWYEQWQESIPQEWRQGFSGREAYVRSQRSVAERQTRPKRFRKQALHMGNPQKESSWPYWAVYKTIQSWALLFGIAAIIFFFCYLMITAVNPHMPFNWGWNSIDHISDIRPFHDYTSAEIVAIESSDDWLALTTSESLTRNVILLDKNNRLPYENIFQIPLLDIVRGLDDNDFLALLDNQAIVRVDPGILGIAQHPWLQPVNSTWSPALKQSIPLTQTEIVASEFEGNEWLVALKGVGIARYLFDSDEQGQIYRTRSWQTGEASYQPLDKAVITEDGIWYTLQGGNILFAERQSLGIVHTRTITTPHIVQLDTMMSGQWVGAIDENHSVWIYPPEGSGWLGPFWGKSGEDCQLDSLEDVTVARLHRSLAWLGTPYGLFAYDTNKRQMYCVLPNVDISHIFIDERINEAQPLTILVSGQDGLYRIKALGPESDSDFQINILDGQRVVYIDLSSDSSQLVYLIPANLSIENYEVKRIQDPFDDGQIPDSIIPGKGWKALSEQPGMVGIESFNSGYLLATTSGAFLYHTDQSTYEDWSTVISKGASEEETLFNFQSLQQSDSGLLAIADNKPLLLLEDEGAPSNWINLDPFGQTNPQHLTETEGQIWGNNAGGEIFLYSQEEDVTVKNYLQGSASSLESYPVEVKQVMGDLRSNTDGTWYLAFLHQDNVITYSSEGEIDENSLPDMVAGEGEVSQIRLVEDGELLYLTADSQLLSQNGDLLFGFRGLPFSPDRITAVIPGQRPDTILLGGPAGYVVEYDWPHGSVQEIAHVASSEVAPGNTVTEIQNTDEGPFFMLSNGTLYSALGTSQTQIGPVEQWSVDRTGQRLWAVKDGDILQYSPEPDSPVYEWEVSDSSTGRGMHSFVDQALYAWQLDEFTVAFFSSDSQVGTYNSRNNLWVVQEVTGLTFPSQFIPYQEHLFILDDQTVLRMNKELEIDPLITLPTTATNVTFYLDPASGQLQVVYNNVDTTILTIWDEPTNDAFIEIKRGNMQSPANFDPSRAVYASAWAQDTITLLDETGAIVEYNYERGVWKTIRPAVSGQSVYGWFSTKVNGDIHILLKEDSQNTILVNLYKDSVTENHLPYSLELLTRVTLPENSCKRPLPPEDLLPCPIINRYQTLYQETGLSPATIFRVADRTLLETENVKINRENQTTTYQIRFNNRWQTMQAQSGGFLEDQAKAFVFSESGQLWVLQESRLMTLVPTNDTLTPGMQRLPLDNYKEVLSIIMNPAGEVHLHHEDSSITVLRELESGLLAPTTPTQLYRLATQNFLEHELTWSWQTNGTISGQWLDETIPFWSSASDEFAIQNAEDVVWTPDNELLIITEAGLLIYDLNWDTLKAFYPETRGGQFLHVYRPDRLLVKTGENAVFEWQMGRLLTLQPINLNGLVSTIQSGPWRWEVNYATSNTIDLNIVHPNDGRERGWRKISPAFWQFNDDIVNWIGHGNTETEVVLHTDDGYWQFDLAMGQRVQSISPGVTDEIINIRNEALAISYSNGTVTFESADDKNIFENGRFFFDTGQKMVGSDGNLFTLIPNRGIVRRDSNSPGQVTGYWPLPPTLSNTISYTLSVSGSVIQLVGSPSNQQDKIVWRLTLSPENVEWRKATVPAEPEATFGPIAWRSQPGIEGKLIPFIALEQGGAVKISNWWYQERFAWDTVTCAGAFNQNNIVLATPLGPLLWQEDSEHHPHITAPGPVSDMNFCTRAYNASQTPYFVVGPDKVEASQYVVFDPDGKVVKNDSRSENLLLKQEILIVDQIIQLNLESIGFRQDQHYHDISENSSDVIVESNLSSFPVETLLRGGQFIFDRAEGLSLADSAESLWIAYTFCDAETDTSCLITVNQLVFDVEANQYRFVLRAMSPSVSGLQAVRPSIERGVLYRILQEENTRIVIEQGNLVDSDITWKVIPTSYKSEEVFRIGNIVSINVEDMAWESNTPLYLWNVEEKVIVSPTNYELFYQEESGAIALAFDVITELKVEQGQNSFAAITRGGVFVCTCPFDDGRLLLALSNPNVKLELDQASGKSNTVHIPIDGDDVDKMMTIHINQSGIEIEINGKPIPYEISNDAWGFDHTLLESIVDFAYDVKSETLWIATRNNGVFKVVPQKLP